MRKPRPRTKNLKPAPARRPPQRKKAGNADPARSFPIVALGASAGGLEALEAFFAHVPRRSGMAYVVITHQHPGHTSLLPELLAKRTGMSVSLARDGQRLEPDTVYVSSPDHCLAILNGALQLMAIKEGEGAHLPIDYFFRSLAEDQRDHAVGVILSGMGTDGTLGLKAIKGAAGLTLAQDPATAKFSAMPANAIATRMVDYVLPPEQMPQRLLAYSRHRWRNVLDLSSYDESSLPDSMQKIILLLRARMKHDFSLYKATNLGRRIERRLTVHGLKGPEEYLACLKDNPQELDLLFKELLIGVTSFFRDPEAFEDLALNVLPDLLESRREDSTIRVWVPGCSTGEEAYTLAIVVRECAERLKKRFTIQIFGTDLDDSAIETARAGFYPDGIAVDVPPDFLARYFVRENGGYRVKKSIRDLIIFAPHNVLRDPLFTKLDLLSCRNLFIYLRADAQRRLLSLFHYALRPRGILLLGLSESIGDLSHDFEAVSKKWKFFRRHEGPLTTRAFEDFPLRTAALDPALSAAAAAFQPEPAAAAVMEKLLVKRFVPASVLVNERGDIRYIHGQTGDYLEPAAGRPRLNLLEMARGDLRFELASSLRRAVTHAGEVVHDAGGVKTPSGPVRVGISVSRIKEPESVRGLLLVSFRSTPDPGSRSRRRKPLAKKTLSREQELERELHFTRESLQSTVEELQSSNEELQSTNEEMQSTNEELETSKEEMQSLNEELQAINAQLQTKVEALSVSCDDMQNLLNSTSIATLFLDSHLKIKRFTEQARAVINLIPSDVGRPVADLVSNLNYDTLAADAAGVLRTLNFKECEVRTKQGDWRLVRILPYRTTENVINGLVITFVDINRLKEAELAAQRSRVFAENIIATVREPMLVLDGDLRVVSASQSFYRFFRVTRAEVEHQLVYDLGDHQWDIPELRKLLERILPKNNAFDDFSVSHDFPRIGRHQLLLNARRIQQKDEKPGFILLAMEDVTQKTPPKEKP